MSLDDENRPTGRRIADNFTAMAERNERSGQRSQSATRWMLLAAFVLVVVGGGLVLLVQNMNDNVEANRVSSEQIQNQINDLKDQVSHLEDFVTDLETSTPEEQAQNAAITEAVSQVPQIKAILCDVFPDAGGCRVP